MEQDREALERMLEGDAPVGFRLHVVCTSQVLTITSDFPFDDGYLSALGEAVLSPGSYRMPDCEETFAFGQIEDPRVFEGKRQRLREALRSVLECSEVLVQPYLHGEVQDEARPQVIADVLGMLQSMRSFHTERLDSYWTTFFQGVYSVLAQAVNDDRLHQLKPGCVRLDPHALERARDMIIEQQPAGDHLGQVAFRGGQDSPLLEAYKRMNVPLFAMADYPLRTAVREFFQLRTEARLPDAERQAAAILLGTLATCPEGMSVPRWFLARRKLAKIAQG